MLNIETTPNATASARVYIDTADAITSHCADGIAYAVLCGLIDGTDGLSADQRLRLREFAWGAVPAP